MSTEVSVFPPEEIRAEVEELMGRYPPEHREAALIPLLHYVQRVRRCKARGHTVSLGTCWLDLPCATQ